MLECVKQNPESCHDHLISYFNQAKLRVTQPGHDLAWQQQTLQAPSANVSMQLVDLDIVPSIFKHWTN